MAVADASFKISIDSMSFGFRSPMPPAMGIPSSTYSGSLDAVSDRVPRTRMLMPSPGLLPLVTISTPGTRPLMASIAFVFGTAATSAPDTDATDPVTSRRACVP